MKQKPKEHFFNYYILQTAVTSIMMALLAVDKESYSGWSWIGYSVVLTLCFFAIMTMLAMDAYRQDEKEQKKIEKMEKRKKIADKKSA